MSTLQKRIQVQQLVNELNRHRHLYYNAAAPEISDAEYDRLFDELASLERETGLILSNSPTQSVGAPVVSFLKKVQHPVELLSLEKTKELTDIAKFIGNRPALWLLKLDGLTIKLEYAGGFLLRASTRGDGAEGEDITHNARTFLNLPLAIPYKGKLVVTGEAVILYSDFRRLQATTVGSDGKTYKNARNLVAGSVRQLDAGECAKRCVRFVAFSVLEGLDGAVVSHRETGVEMPVDTNSKSSMLRCLNEMGFTTVFLHLLNKGKTANMRPRSTSTLDEKVIDLQAYVEQMQAYAAEKEYPIDGLVVSYDDVVYSKSLGKTSHHYRDGLAYKFEDEKVETVLREVEWSVSRSGELAPVAVFDTVELDGTEVSRASLHNLDFINGLDLQISDRILVSKRNMIIPHVEENLNKGTNRYAPSSVYPEKCPSCGGPVSVYPFAGSEPNGNLNCTNLDCPGRKLKQLVHYVSKKAMDIDGLSEATLKRFLVSGLVTCEADMYELHSKTHELYAMEGFGERAVEKLLNAIEESRTTTMEKFIISMDIPDLGRHASAILCKAFSYDLARIEEAAAGDYDFTALEDFGDVLHNNIHEWFRLVPNREKWERISALMNFMKPAAPTVQTDAGNPFFGKTVVATGSFENYTRDSINVAIAALGAKAGSSVSKKTDFIIAGEKAGSKKAKAEELGVRILTEAEFMAMSNMI